MKNYDVVIIGCGASGSMCAMHTKSKSVAVIDLNLKPAKKLMVTGNGRCNLTNIKVNSSFYNQNIDKYLERFNVQDTLNFFSSLGLVWYNDEEGRVYPLSNSAKSVVDVLSENLERKIDIFCNNLVQKINKTQDSNFEIVTDKDIFIAKKLVIATGGKSIVEEIKSFGISVKPNIPSLVALRCVDVKKELNGIKVSNVKVKARNDENEASETGEVLFKESGLSGIVIFNLSTLFSRKGEFKGEIALDLFPNMDIKSLSLMLKQRKNLKVTMNKFFIGMFQNALAMEILTRANIRENKKCETLTDTEIENLSKVIKNLSFKVVDCYDNNQVYSGGVRLQELDNNLMSKTIPNLYFCGEVCDVDGVCGGYNLQWAWTSGKIVGESL